MALSPKQVCLEQFSGNVFPIKHNRIESAILGSMLDYSTSFHTLKQKRRSHQNMLARYLIEKNKAKPKNKINYNQDASIRVTQQRGPFSRQVYSRLNKNSKDKSQNHSDQHSDSSIEIQESKSCSWNHLFHKVNNCNKNRSNEDLIKILLKDFMQKKTNHQKPYQTQQKSVSDKESGDSKNINQAKKVSSHKKQQIVVESKRNYRSNVNTSKITIMRIVDLEKVIKRQRIRKNTSPHLAPTINSEPAANTTPLQRDSLLNECTQHNVTPVQQQMVVNITYKLPEITSGSRTYDLKASSRGSDKIKAARKVGIKINNIEHLLLKKRWLKVNQQNNIVDTSISLKHKDKMPQKMHGTQQKASSKDISVEPWSTSELKPQQKIDLLGDYLRL